jgi:alkylation response protein AidB-like acyl-CoA dehydrogenase
VDFATGEDVDAVASLIADFFDRRDDARAIAEASAAGKAMSRARWEALCKIGLPALRMPEPDGIGAGLRDSTVVAERLGAVLLPEPASASIVVAHAMNRHGGSSDLVEAMLDGTRIVALAAHHAVTGQADGTLTGRIRAADDDVTDLLAIPVSGPWTTPTPASPARSAITLLDRSALCAVTERCDVDPSRPTTLCEIDGVVPVETVPMTPEDVATVVRDWAVLALSELVGGMQAVLAATIAFAQEREQFGRSIGGFQAIKHQLANMYIAVEQARAAVQFAAISCDRAAAAAVTDVAAAARWVPRSAIDLFDNAIHLHGAMGYSWEVGVHLHLRRAVATRSLLHESRVTEPRPLHDERKIAS